MAENKELKADKSKVVPEGLYVGNAAVIVTDFRTTEPSNFRETDKDGKTLPANSRTWIEWGINDNYPDIIEDKNSEEPVSSRCLDFKTKACIGQGLFWYRKRFEDGKEYHDPVDMQSPEMRPIKEFADASDLDAVLRDLALDGEWWNQCYTELIANKSKTRFLSMSRLDASFCRVAPKDAKGFIPKVFVSTKFSQKKPQKKDLIELDMVDKDNPFKYPKVVYRAVRNSSRRNYYPKPSWHSIFGALDLSLETFTWIRSNLSNSKNIKYLIKVPWNYFLSRIRIEDYNNDRKLWLAAIKEDEVRLYAEMDEMLAGGDNASKSFKTKYGKDEDGQEIEGFDIVPIKNETNHEAWLPLYNTTAAAICSGHGVAPALASIQVSNTMGANSGSTMREQYNFYSQFETIIPRQVVLESLNFVKKVNGWPSDIYPGFRSMILETLDNNKSGVRTEGEGNPTTSNKES
jgi:hypothetical protein